MEKKGSRKRLAVLVGCNYPNTSNELHGCINDVVLMRESLVNRLRFDPTHIQLLIDDDHHGSSSVINIMPTGENIKKALETMIDEAQPGDTLFFHYSGHGTRIPSMKPGNPFRHDEAIVPCDFNLITGLFLSTISLFSLNFEISLFICNICMPKVSAALTFCVQFIC